MKRLLNQLSINESARIVSIESEHQYSTRLLELGFLPGTKVTLIRRAPLGGAAIYSVRGYYIGLREDESGIVVVV